MAERTIPSSLVDLVTTNALAHLTTVRADGALAPAIVWVDFDGEHVLVTSPVGARKGRNVRSNPNVALSVVDRANPFRYLQMRGRVTGVRPDDDLAVTDRMAHRYAGGPYQWRERPREVLEVTLDNVRTAGA